jgi:Xaa-Pro aminopeptidase
VNYIQRLDRTRHSMDALGVDVLLASCGPDLLYLTGYEATPLERLTALILTRGNDPVLLVPRLEAARVEERSEVFTLETWDEDEDPVERVAATVRSAQVVAVADHASARLLLALQDALPRARFIPASLVTSGLRARKDEAEIRRLRAAAEAVDAIAQGLRTRSFGGRTEREIQRMLIELILDAGHDRANFAIVATGPNSASPHHEPGERRAEAGDVVLCDFGGTMEGYCSDITRMFVVDEVRPEVQDAYDALSVAQETAVNAATVGTPCQQVDAVARDLLGQSGLADQFIHRIGHGIGLEAHEDPYLVVGNDTPLAPGHAFSIEPGVYFPGQFGLRIEDIVVADAAGPRRLNSAARDLAVVE